MASLRPPPNSTSNAFSPVADAREAEPEARPGSGGKALWTSHSIGSRDARHPGGRVLGRREASERLGDERGLWESVPQPGLRDDLRRGRSWPAASSFSEGDGSAYRSPCAGARRPSWPSGSRPRSAAGPTTSGGAARSASRTPRRGGPLISGRRGRSGSSSSRASWASGRRSSSSLEDRLPGADLAPAWTSTLGSRRRGRRGEGRNRCASHSEDQEAREEERGGRGNRRIPGPSSAPDHAEAQVEPARRS